MSFAREYDFFEVIDDITYTASDNKIYTVPKGEFLLRVGEGVVSDFLPIESMYLLGYNLLIMSKKVRRVSDKQEIMTQTLLFHNIIVELKVKITTEVLTHLTIFKEFLEVPDNLRESFKKDIEDIL